MGVDWSGVCWISRDCSLEREQHNNEAAAAEPFTPRECPPLQRKPIAPTWIPWWEPTGTSGGLAVERKKFAF